MGVWFRVFLSLLRRHNIPLDSHLKALDIGCGHGMVINQMEEVSNWDVDGADINMTALCKGKAKRGQKYFYNIADQHASLVESFDAVFLFDVIEHIAEPHHFLASALGHVKPGGYLIINVPALQSLFSVYDQAAGHIRRYSRNLLSAELSGLPVEVLEMAYWGMSLVPVLAVRKLLLTEKKESGEILQKGFEVTNKTVNQFFLGLMKIETSLLKHPPIGASLFAIVQKK
ncbi:MAG: class I SAM-dependent methyltransferase [Candidatus Electrothrix sp. ATG2]|nr:class I SAM-dependent methyltransferase [Candidatus Electrothrix sp. ATG2]